ncbi:MAG: heavy metal-binding domain-containing protein, partial [Planctomycetota bacterium]
MANKNEGLVLRTVKLIWRQTGALIAVVLIIAAFLFGRSTKTAPEGPVESAVPAVVAPDEKALEGATPKVVDVWTCPMHPQVRQPRAGRCPLCGMALVAADSGAGDAVARLEVSEAAVSLMNVQTTPVERRYVEAEIRMVGKIEYDETRLSDITARVGGRLDRLFVDYTGVPVR